MQDTSDEIKKLQHQQHMLLSVQERWARGFEMIENGRATLLDALKQKFPNDTNADIFIKMVRTLYKNDLSEEFLDDYEKDWRALNINPFIN